LDFDSNNTLPPLICFPNSEVLNDNYEYLSYVKQPMVLLLSIQECNMFGNYPVVLEDGPIL